MGAAINDVTKGTHKSIPSQTLCKMQEVCSRFVKFQSYIMDQDDYREGHRSQLYQVEPISRSICVLKLSFTRVSMTGLLEKYYEIGHG